MAAVPFLPTALAAFMLAGQGARSADSVPGIAALEQALARYAGIAARGGWSVLPPGNPLEPGMADSRVPALRRRLEAEGFPVVPAQGDTLRYDAALEAAVRRFQELHGLAVDGSVGRGTLAALNVTAERRRATIAVNLARLRGARVRAEDRAVIVNIPAFTLDVLEGGRSLFHARVVVGRRTWPTPTADSRITDLVFRPRWVVPRSIAVSELLPIARRDPGYFARNGFRIFADSVSGAEVPDAASIDWGSVTDAGLRYWFVQEPGPGNPLGGVKFLMRTPYDVYLHDTPSRALFARERRTFSHGCVRVEEAERLVALLLPGWSADSIRAAMVTGRDRRVRVPAPIPAHLVYRTAWGEGDGLVAFREDIYRLDAPPSRRP